MKKSFALIPAIIALLAAGAAQAKDFTMLKGPYLQNVKPDAVTVMWETGAPGPSTVEFGETTALGSKAEAPAPATIHEVTLTGLKQGQTYYYVASTGDARGKGAFHTAVDAATPFRFAVWGDNRTDFLTHAKVAKAIEKAKPDFAVNVGDVVTDGTKYEQWGREYFIPIRDLARNVPTFISIGNHERDSEWFYKFVSQPGNEGWFSFDYGNAHFTVMDSNKPYKPGSEQYEWLVGDLSSEAARRATWRILFKHHPEFSEGWDEPGYSGEPDMVEHLSPLYEKYGVDITFAGHTHDYERGLLRGVYYIVTGGGGAALDTFMQDIPHMTVYASEYQYCAVDVAGGSLRFQSLKPDGEVIDSFELKK